jgi:hypothetical protein
MPREPLIRVHGVVSSDEAAWFEALGVDLIGVAVGEPAEGRVVSAETARQIAGQLTRARLCVELITDLALAPDEAHRMGAGFVTVPWGREVPRAWREALARLGLGWALVRVPADEDDDPSWIQSRIEETGAPRPTWVEVEVCPNLEDGWSVIREPHESDLDAVDLDQLARVHPILYSLAFRLDNIRSIREALNHANGFSFTLADRNGGVAGAHRYGKEELRAVLEQLLTRGVDPVR